VTDEKIIVGKQTKRVVLDDYIVLRVDSEGRLIVVTAVAAPLVVDVIDRAGRLVGIVYGENAQLQQLTPADGVSPNQSLETTGFLMVYDPAANDWNRVREGAGIGQALVDVANRATRLLGVVYGSQAQQLQQKAATFELLTEDTGLNTNPERWMHDNHWEANEVTIAAAGAPGQQNLGVAVPALQTRRIRALHVRHAGTNNTVLTLLIAGGAIKRSWDIPFGTTRILSGGEDGWEFTAGQQPAVQTSDVTGGSTYVGAEGVEA
jgi:hypothetical protein